MIRVLLVDDQQLVRAGLRMLCDSADDLEVVGEAEDGHEAVLLAESQAPDVVLMDLRMPRVDGIVATQRITDRIPSARVVVLTTFDDDDHLYPALAAGACGFLAKDMSPERLLDAIRRAHAGETPFTPRVLRRLVDKAVSGQNERKRPSAPATPEVDLTTREREVVEQVGAGLSNAEISERLHMGVTTVKTHIASLMAKTGCANRVQLAVFAAQAGMVPATGHDT
jgi:DNA-binding NarL/FixJ family response regulator